MEIENSKTNSVGVQEIEKTVTEQNETNSVAVQKIEKTVTEQNETNSVAVPEIEKTVTEQNETNSENIEKFTKENEIEKNEENDDKTCDNASEKSKKDSFKKPALLIGPRRGKPGQLRTVSTQNVKSSENTAEQSQIDEEKCEDKNINIAVQENVNKGPVGEKQQIPLQYKEPTWSGAPTAEYKIEVLKSGVILQVLDISDKCFHVIGRLPTCDISLAHPTISRYHAILQYRNVQDDKHSKGFYLYDLGSTHGTFWNGFRVRPNTYVKLQGGHMIRFGCSQRKFILQTPPEDMEEESDLSVTELKEKRRLELLERERAEQELKEQEEENERLRIQKEEEEGINWGMGEDADEETDLTENPYALTNNEELFLDDPKKTLRGWFEREGHDLQYQTEEKGIGQFLCWVDLPLDTSTGRSVRAEALVKGKKKESVIQCALEACRILDRHGVLRQATHEARKRKTRNWEEEDFYDSDEDNFLDRTGTVEKKREQRMRQAGKLEEKPETYASLLEKHTAVTKKIVSIEKELRKSQKMKEAAMADDEDALDAFMSSLNSTMLNKADVTKMKLELQGLRKEEERLLKLVNITKPANLPSLTSQQSSHEVPKTEKSVKQISNVGKKRSIDRDSHSSPVKKTLSTNNQTVSKAPIEEPDNGPQQQENNERVTDLTTVDPPIDEDSKSIETSNTQETTNMDSETSHLETSTSANTNDLQKNESEIVKKKKRNMRRMQQRADKAAKVTQKGYEDDAYDEDYSMWLPPQNQSGDGKTNLNEKYGY